MANEIIKTDKRAVMLYSMRPEKERLDSQQFKKHRALVAFELEVTSTKIGRFGWDRMNPAMKDRLTLDWMDALDPYGLDEIKAACDFLLKSKPKDATNEQQVKNAIIKSRAKAFAALPKQYAIAPNVEAPTEESKARVQEMVKSFAAARRMKRPVKN